jgi:hypothetical protein
VNKSGFVVLALVLGAMVLGAMAAGCKGLQGPNWSRPGPAPYQQRMAERFDPYPDSQIGPAVVGGRPRDYQIPPPEPARARWPVPGVSPSGNAAITPMPAATPQGF